MDKKRGVVHLRAAEEKKWLPGGSHSSHTIFCCRRRHRRVPASKEKKVPFLMLVVEKTIKESKDLN